MSLVHAIRHKLRVFFRGEAYAAEQAEEIRAHVELEAMQQMSAGANDDDAHAAARRRLGNETQTRENVRAASGFSFSDRVKQDVGYAVRALIRTPAYTVTVIVTLALGVGANAAILSFLDRMFFQLPDGVRAPEGVRRVYWASRQNVFSQPSGAAFVSDGVTYAAFEAMRDAVEGRAELAAHSEPDSFAVVFGARRMPAHIDWVTQSYFHLLGVAVTHGRVFDADESRMDAPGHVVVLAHAYWQRAFGGDVNIVGKTLNIWREPYTVIGITAPGFSGIDVSAVDMFAPLGTYSTSYHGDVPWYRDDDTHIAVIARAAPSEADAAIATRMTSAFRRSEEYWANRDQKTTGAVDSVSRVLTGSIIAAQGPMTRTQTVTMALRLLGVASIVLIIAAANVATLALVRASRRRREIAVRLALGVSRARLTMQILTETAVLSVAAGGTAVLVAAWGGSMLRRLLLPSTQWASSVLNVRVALVAAAIAFVAGMLASIAPVAHALNNNVGAALRAGANDSAYRKSRLRSVLLVSQGALSLVLLVAAALFVRSLDNVKSLPTGYDAAHLLLATVTEIDVAPNRDQLARDVEAIATRMRDIPGVSATAVAHNTPMRSAMFITRLYRPGRPEPLQGARIFPAVNMVSPDYFETVGTRIVDGRSFLPGEKNVMIIDESMANAFWPGERAVGQCVMQMPESGNCTQVVGVAGNTSRFRRIEERPLQYYLPHPLPRTVLVRVERGHERVVADSLRAGLTRALPHGEEANIRMMSTDLDRELRPWRLYAALYTALGLLALIVAAIGTYSVIAYSVSQRSREMGIRVALGARVRDVLDLVVGEGMRVLAIAVATGVVLSLVLGRLVRTLLFGVTASDPYAMIGAACVLLAAGMIACVIPAWRAARVDPMTTLRAD